MGCVTFAPLSCILCTASTTPSLKGSLRPTMPSGRFDEGEEEEREEGEISGRIRGGEEEEGEEGESSGRIRAGEGE